MPVPGPTLLRRQLGRRLKVLREKAGVTTQEVEDAKIVSRAKLWRMEHGQIPLKVPDVVTLCRLYKAGEEQTDALAALAIKSMEHGWWEEYADIVPSWFRLCVGLEAAANSIRFVDDSLVPGLLQTADYARAVYAEVQSDTGEQTIGRHVGLRLERQEAFFGRTPAPTLTAVVGEGVLRRPVGGPEVLAAQLAHLRELDSRDAIEIRVLPFAAGAHAAMTGAFRIMDFDDPDDPDVVYVETHVGAHYLEQPEELSVYNQLFDLVMKKSVPLGEIA